MIEQPIVIECEAKQYLNTESKATFVRCARCERVWNLGEREPLCQRVSPQDPFDLATKNANKTYVFLVSQERIERITKAPAFGMAYWSLRLILVREDLPESVRRAIIAHECNHIERGNHGGFWANEIPAWWAQIKAEPLGTALAVVMSLHPRRLAWYARRIFVNNH